MLSPPDQLIPNQKRNLHKIKINIKAIIIMQTLAEMIIRILSLSKNKTRKLRKKNKKNKFKDIRILSLHKYKTKKITKKNKKNKFKKKTLIKFGNKSKNQA